MNKEKIIAIALICFLNPTAWAQQSVDPSTGDLIQTNADGSQNDDTDNGNRIHQTAGPAEIEGNRVYIPQQNNNASNNSTVSAQSSYSDPPTNAPSTEPAPAPVVPAAPLTPPDLSNLPVMTGANNLPHIHRGSSAPVTVVPNPSSLWASFICYNPPARTSDDCMNQGKSALIAAGCTLSRIENQAGQNSVCASKSVGKQTYWDCKIKTTNCYTFHQYDKKDTNVACPNPKTLAIPPTAPENDDTAYEKQYKIALAQYKASLADFEKQYPMFMKGGGLGLPDPSKMIDSNRKYYPGKVCIPSDQDLAKWSGLFPNGIATGTSGAAPAPGNAPSAAKANGTTTSP